MTLFCEKGKRKKGSRSISEASHKSDHQELLVKKDFVVFARGDGIGPEIMEATLSILDAAGASLDLHEIAIGEKVYLEGHRSGISEASWELLRESKAFLKAPITTPQGGGFKSLNVTVRGALGLYANVRPARTYTPFVPSKHDGMDLVIVRENEEDLYAGIEYKSSPETVHALKVITQGGCERIIRYAFDYAREHGRKKVTCFAKDNILKLSDGLFAATFEEIAKEYPSLETESWIIDIGAAKLADTPERFDVIVCANLYGDIISDIAAQVAGSVGLAGSANIGLRHAMFEAIHGSAPRRAGQDVANPSGLIMGAIMMLEHLGQYEVAKRIYDGWAATIEAGIHTYDLFDKKLTKKKVGTKEFAKEVINRLGSQPQNLSKYLGAPLEEKGSSSRKKTAIPPRVSSDFGDVCDGVDLFITFPSLPGAEGSNRATDLARLLEEDLHIGFEGKPRWKLEGIANRGTSLWPTEQPFALCSDHYRCRFTPLASEGKVKPEESFALGAMIARKRSVSQAHLLFEGSYTLFPHQQ